MSGLGGKILMRGLFCALAILVLFWALADLAKGGRDYLISKVNWQEQGLTVFTYNRGQDHEPAKWRRLAGANTSFPLGPKPGAVNYRATLVGWLNLQSSQTIRVTAGSDDGVRVYINGVRVIEDWSQHSIRQRSKQVALDAGGHLVMVKYFQDQGESFLNLAFDAEDGAALPVRPLLNSFSPEEWAGQQRLAGLMLPLLLSLCAVLFPLAAAWLLAPGLQRIFAGRFRQKPARPKVG